MNATGESLLLRGWKKVRVKDIADAIQYGYTASAINRKDGPRLLRITDIQNGHVDWNSVPSCDIPEEDIPKYRLSPGDLVFARTGATTGKSYLIGDCPEAVFASYLIRVRASVDVSPRYLSAYFQSPDYWRQIESGKRGIGQPNVNGKVLGEVEFPLAPLTEQHEIVAEIEKQFTRLEAGVAGLRRVQANLKRYRTAVLKAACEGKLVPTEAELARERQKVAAASRRCSSEENQSRDGFATQEGPGYESGAQLLERILIQRHQWFDRQQAQLNTKKKYIEPARPETSNLPELSEGWVYASVDQLGIVGEQAVLTGPFGTNLGREDFTDTGVPMLTISCLKDTGIHLEKADFVSEEKALELDRYRLAPGDLLFSRMASVGRAGIIGEGLRGALFNYHIMRLRLEPTVLLAKFYLGYVRGSAQVKDYLREVNHGATRAGINTEQLLNMPVVLPPLAEQTRIVAEVERHLSVVEELEAVVNTNLQRATRLRQSILQRAFTGNLLNGSN